MLFKDEPEHRRLRAFVEGFFRKKAVYRYADHTREISESILQGMSPNDTTDIVASFAEALPLLIIADLLGIPKDYSCVLRELSRAITNGADAFTANTSALDAKMNAYRDLESLLLKGLSGEWEIMPESLLSHLRLLREDSSLSARQAISMLLLLLFAGHETTIALIGSSLYLLLSHPEQLKLLKDNPDLIERGIEEVLRYETPLQRSTFRMTTADVSVEGHPLSPGCQVSLILGSANRDETIFPDADLFMINRSPNPHLAFGRGDYHCLGRHLAVLEARISVQAFFRYFPQSSLAGNPVWQPNTFIRSLDSLPTQLAR
jgi:cytochrome P450